MARARPADSIFEIGAYSGTMAARYARIPYQTLRYWMLGRGKVPPIAEPAETSPLVLSFSNLLECHVLNALRTTYNLHLPRVRSVLDMLKKMTGDRHPLLNSKFSTDGISLFVDRGALVDVSKGGQYAIRDAVDLYLRRIEWHADGMAKFYPFVASASANEPKIISINPSVASGKSVIDGTGISTAIIASRFWAREDPAELAREYQRPEQEILEAIRWEGEYRRAA